VRTSKHPQTIETSPSELAEECEALVVAGLPEECTAHLIGNNISTSQSMFLTVGTPCLTFILFWFMLYPISSRFKCLITILVPTRTLEKWKDQSANNKEKSEKIGEGEETDRKGRREGKKVGPGKTSLRFKFKIVGEGQPTDKAAQKKKKKGNPLLTKPCYISSPTDIC